MIPITDVEIRALKGPNQIFGEWKSYLQFTQRYFSQLGILHPVVVEIGTQRGRQKAHYERFLDAVHIGIDISNSLSTPDILGDSHATETLVKLNTILAGRDINLLFIDASHTYVDTLADYELYGPLVSDIIALHDIRHEKEIGRCWKDIRTREKDNPNLSFVSIGAIANGWCELGIGLLVRQSKTELKRIMGY